MRRFIRESLRRILLENINLNVSERKALINLGLKTAFNDVDMAKEHLNNSLNTLNNLPDPVTLYRVVFVDSMDEINKDEIGTHYVLNKRDLESTHQQISHVGGGKPIMLKVKAPKALIDYKETLSNKMQYPHEKEITLLNKGRGSKIIDASEFKTRDDEFGMDDFDVYGDL